MTDTTEFPADFALNSIQHGDCVELLRKLPDGCAQLVIADPPYNLGPRFGLEKEWFRDEKVDHPTQKPLSLTDRIVTHFSEPGAVVVVPFAGSGTECLSASRNNRQFWGCEIKPEYVALAESRLESEPAAQAELW